MCPMMIPQENPLSSVSDVFNAVMVKGNMAGTLMFYGSGAGKRPTASAVVADIMETAMNMDRNLPFGWGQERQTLTPVEKTEFSYFLRFEGSAQEKKAEIEAAFGPARFVELPGMDEFAVLTGKMTEEHYRKVSAAFGDIRQMIRAQI